MSDYQANRDFSDYVHYQHALDQVYDNLNWLPCEIDPNIAELLDNKHGIDYLFYSDRRGLIKVQERFRDGWNAERFNDITIRYQRPITSASRPEEKRSEFFKMKADVMLYGFVKGSKTDFKSIERIQKYVIVDLHSLYGLFDSGDIVISKISTKSCSIQRNKLVVPEISHDGFSTFLAIDIPKLVDLFGHGMIIDQQGYF